MVEAHRGRWHGAVEREEEVEKGSHAGGVSNSMGLMSLEWFRLLVIRQAPRKAAASQQGTEKETLKLGRAHLHTDLLAHTCIHTQTHTQTHTHTTSQTHTHTSTSSVARHAARRWQFEANRLLVSTRCSFAAAPLSAMLLLPCPRHPLLPLPSHLCSRSVPC